MKRRHALITGPLLALAAALPGPAGAQDYLTKTVKIVAPVQPGGGADLVTRTVAEQFGKFMRADIAKCAKPARERNISVES
jgi:tripartite-type tricarboxylate transporter receptor subunit TctC